MTAFLLAMALALTSSLDVGAGPFHDLHVSYGSSVVEGNVVVVRIRFFQDDLEAAIRSHSGREDFTLAVNPDTDALFMSYFSEHFGIELGGSALAGRIVGSGEDALDREPVWWYAVQFEASEPVRSFRVRNTLLLGLFDDQRNIVKFVHLPDETQKTYSFGHGEEVFHVEF